ncbi:MAG: hypothetical protein K2X09_06515 [Rickettsiales bacterium]|nr:hypothetical protein [Rickettsiales bacterium]
MVEFSAKPPVMPFVAKPQIGVNITHYSWEDNNPNGNYSNSHYPKSQGFGSYETASGLNISAQHYTCAIPLMARGNYKPQFFHHKDPYQIGDLLYVWSPLGQVVVLATDEGIMPLGAVDLVDGVATRAIGYSKAREKRNPNAYNGEEGNRVIKIGSVRGPNDEEPTLQDLKQARALLLDVNGNNTMQPLLDALGSDGKPLMRLRATNVDFDSFATGDLLVTSSKPEAGNAATTVDEQAAKPEVEQAAKPEAEKTTPTVAEQAEKPEDTYSVLGLQKRLERAGLATDRGGADDKQDGIAGKITRQAAREAKALLEDEKMSNQALFKALGKPDQFKALADKVTHAIESGDVTKSGFIRTPAFHDAPPPHKPVQRK